MTARATIVGCSIDRLDMEETLSRCDGLIAGRRQAQHVAVNAAKIVAMQNDRGLRNVIERCDLVSADGQSVVWASRLLGDPLPERVAGIDLMTELLALAERRGYRVFILGAKPDVLARATERIMERHPRLVLAGTRDGYFGDQQDAEVAAEVAASNADILFVAISSPKKEYWLGSFREQIGVPFVMGVGGSVDVLAGMTKRAPVLLQRLGLEWAYRLAQEPGRLWRRYLVTNIRFLALVARELGLRMARRGSA